MAGASPEDVCQLALGGEARELVDVVHDEREWSVGTRRQGVGQLRGRLREAVVLAESLGQRLREVTHEVAARALAGARGVPGGGPWTERGGPREQGGLAGSGRGDDDHDTRSIVRHEWCQQPRAQQPGRLRPTAARRGVARHSLPHFPVLGQLTLPQHRAEIVSASVAGEVPDGSASRLTLGTAGLAVHRGWAWGTLDALVVEDLERLGHVTPSEMGGGAVVPL